MTNGLKNDLSPTQILGAAFGERARFERAFFTFILYTLHYYNGRGSVIGATIINISLKIGIKGTLVLKTL